MKIEVSTYVDAPIDLVWTCWTSADEIINWNFASPEWHSPSAQIDLIEGGTFNYRMEARDGSMGFDFTGIFTQIIDESLIKFKVDDDREVEVQFSFENGVTKVSEIFEAEDESSAEQQKRGWQAILNNFAQYVESK